MPLIADFWVEGEYLGFAPRTLTFVHAEAQEPHSLCYVCPQCGDAWARCRMAGGKMTNWWMTITANCRKHAGHSLIVPGSLWLSWDKELTDSFPDGVLKWEFDRHIDYYEGVSHG